MLKRLQAYGGGGTAAGVALAYVQIRLPRATAGATATSTRTRVRVRVRTRIRAWTRRGRDVRRERGVLEEDKWHEDAAPGCNSYNHCIPIQTEREVWGVRVLPTSQSDDSTYPP